MQVVFPLPQLQELLAKPGEVFHEQAIVRMFPEKEFEPLQPGRRLGKPLRQLLTLLQALVAFFLHLLQCIPDLGDGFFLFMEPEIKGSHSLDNLILPALGSDTFLHLLAGPGMFSAYLPVLLLQPFQGGPDVLRPWRGGRQSAPRFCLNRV